MILSFGLLMGIFAQLAEAAPKFEIACRVAFPGNDFKNVWFSKEIDLDQENILSVPGAAGSAPAAWVFIGPISSQGAFKWTVRVYGEDQLTLITNGEVTLERGYFDSYLEKGKGNVVLGTFCRLSARG